MAMSEKYVIESDVDDDDDGVCYHIFECMPAIAYNVFRFLNVVEKCRVARVCKSFRLLVYKKSLWQHDILEIELAHADCFKLKAAIRRGIQRVRLYGYRIPMLPSESYR